MVEFQFVMEQNLRYNDAVAAMFDLLDFFDESDSFDDIEWDADNDAAFVANEDMEVELVLNEGSIEVFVVLHAPDLRKHQIQSNLTKDIGQFFGVKRRASAGSHRRDWQGDSAGSRESSGSFKGSGRFGRLHSGGGGTIDHDDVRESRSKARPQGLPSRRDDADDAPAVQRAPSRSADSAKPSERKAPAPLKKADDVRDNKVSEVAEAKAADSSKKPPHGLMSKPSAPPTPPATEEKKEGSSGFWWWMVLLILAGGAIALYLSPLWPFAK